MLARHALVAGLGASALVHVGIALGALTLTAASTNSEMLAIMELAPLPGATPAVAPTPAPPEPKEVASPTPVASAAPRPRTVRKAARRTATPELAPLAAATSHSDPVAPPRPVAQAEASSTARSPPPQSTATARSPGVLARVEPHYPAAARRDRIQGVVRIEAQLDRTGRILALRVRKSIPLLDPAALAALRQWRFSPARDERGTAIAAIVIVPVRFALR